MEEILASIRRIISEESEPAAAAPATAPEAARAPFAEDDILELTDVVEDEPASAPLTAQELADLAMAGDDGEEPGMDEPEVDAPEVNAPELDAHDVELAEDDAGFSEDEAPAADFADDDFAPEPEPEPARKDAADARQAAPGPADWLDVVDPADEDEAIMSAAGAAAVRDSFGQLSDLLVAGYAGSNKTLEGMVREMLRPMLKNWLDANLPAIVERAVAREIARLARVKRP